MIETEGLEPILWTDALSVGVPEIDGEHMALLDLYNDILSAFDEGCDIEEKRRLLCRLDAYAFYHFATEEALMRVCRYPKAREHNAEHARFRDKVAAYQDQLTTNTVFEEEVLAFMGQWIANHIRTVDQALGAFLSDVSTRWLDQRQAGDGAVSPNA